MVQEGQEAGLLGECSPSEAPPLREGWEQYGGGGVIRKGGKEEMVPREWAGGREVVSSSLRGKLWETETLFVTKL